MGWLQSTLPVNAKSDDISNVLSNEKLMDLKSWLPLFCMPLMVIHVNPWLYHRFQNPFQQRFEGFSIASS